MGQRVNAKSAKVAPESVEQLVYVEEGAKKVFACSLAWPGLSRSGRGEEAALEALDAYASRYAPVAAAAGQRFPEVGKLRWVVVEHVPTRSGGADFGVPTTVLDRDFEPCGRAEAGRLASLLSAAWSTLDEVAATAPAELVKGPRGGGRDRDAITQHVANAEQLFARKVGLKLPAPEGTRTVLSNRAAVLEWCNGAGADAATAGADAAGAGADAAGAGTDAATAGAGGAGAGPTRAPQGWPLRYALRRLTWHVLDHAWEIEDRSRPHPPAALS